ncbi:MAG: hypothetical protein WCL38_05615, partial [Actinomycetota bacterium]
MDEVGIELTEDPRAEVWSVLGFALLACSVLVAGFLGYLLIGTSVSEAEQQQRLPQDLGPILPRDMIT